MLPVKAAEPVVRYRVRPTRSAERRSDDYATLRRATLINPLLHKVAKTVT